jgi:hypothetical protein
MDHHVFDAHAHASRRKRRRALIALLMSASLVTLGAGAMSLAVFTDSEASSGAWSTGTIDLVLDDSTVFNASDVFPGDSGSQTLNVANNGSGELRYDMSVSVIDDADGLAGEFDLGITEGACPGVGSVYSGSLLGATLTDRVLAAGADEDLCLTWSLPLSTDSAFQGATAEVSFDFDAEQTKNNP